MTAIWNSTNVAPSGTGRIPKDVSSGGAPSHVTEQQLADLGVTVGQTVQALGTISTNTTITISSGGYVTATIGGALTFTFSGAPTGGCIWHLVLTNGGSSVVTWPGSVSWTGGTAPTLRTSGVDILRFHSADGGTSWVGELAYDEQDIDASDITSGTLDAARLPLPTTTTIGGIKRNTGSAGQYVTGVDASGNLTYDTPAGGGSPGGASGQPQFNNGGAFGGMATVTWDAISSRISFGAGASPAGKVHAQSGAASEVAFIAQAASAQTGNVLEVRNSSGGVMAAFLASGVLHINTSVGPIGNHLWLGSISNPGAISLRGNPEISGQYGLGFHSSLDATFLFGYAGRKFALGTRQLGGAYNARFTFDDAAGVQTWTHSEGINYVFGTATGTKLGTSTSQKLGFWNATPVVQPTAVADATDNATAITQLNALLSRLRTIGMIAT